MKRRSTKENLLKASVGEGAANDPKDVLIVEYLFNICNSVIRRPFPEAGRCSTDLILEIRRFQRNELRYPHADGRVDPAGRTLHALVEKARTLRPKRTDLNKSSRPYLAGGSWCGPSGEVAGLLEFLEFKRPPASQQTQEPGTAHRAVVDSYLSLRERAAAGKLHRLKAAVNSGGSFSKLTDADFQAALAALGNGITLAMVKAFAEVESGGKSGFGPAGLPVIAFEGHWFRKLTNKKYDQTHPMLSYKYVKKAGPEWQANNKDQETAWKTLNDAIALDSDAALQACSWGMFQVMGFNFKDCGFSKVEDFVASMKAGERGQLDAFVGWCKAKPARLQALKDKKFATIATLYNGEDYGNYDVLLEQAYKRHGGS
ncbi:N-acetylmuramidase family protein [Methylomonas sp. ZR1]|uniref:N-acetylmuramidase family protein n=1 Tax=Methylomonas sp. ZR1 TaxID=1797072 RepID=UPI0014917269|nr:N-acetylmuramidase family protein [Methylomonas sp. ZR1]NOV30835.1 DUF3380 domain-containing protein [Methylomonas sp. ZR1]